MTKSKRADESERNEKSQHLEEAGGRERKDYHVDIATGLGVGAVRLLVFQQTLSETLAPKDSILCPESREGPNCI